MASLCGHLVISVRSSSSAPLHDDFTISIKYRERSAYAARAMAVQCTFDSRQIKRRQLKQ